MTVSGGLRQRLFALPKAELHLHMYGAMRRSTLTELCEAAGRAVPQFPAGKLANFAQFSDIFDAVKDCVSCEGDLRRLVREVVEDQASVGCSSVELQCSPQHLPDVPDDDAFWRIVFDEAVAAGKQFDVTVCFISVIVRSLVSPEAAIDVAEDAVARAQAGGAIVGLGLAGAENDPTPFAPAFAVAKQGGLLCLPHQGELDVEGGGPPFVDAAVELLGADRLGHGISSVASPATTAALALKQICCEVCPTSNVRIGDTAAVEYSTHPLPELLRAGVPCCLGTDDPTVSL
jgi:adenosine deaminase